MTKKTRIRIGIIVVIVRVMGFSDWSFAEDNEGLKILGRSVQYIVSVLSWLWIIFAKIAGEFLTNKRIYGGVLGLDVLLRKYWNVIKNLANFGLGSYFVYIIFKGLIGSGKESIASTLKNNLLWLLIAAIGIQVSWFLTAAVIDISTISLAAAGSLPSQIMSNNSNIESSVKDNLKNIFSANGTNIDKPIHIELFCKESSSTICNKGEEDQKMENPQSLTGLIDQIMPSAEDVSGPLYFMGFSILKANDIPNISSINTTNSASIMGSIFNLIIQGGTSIIFAIEMFVLCIAALIRIIYLWMFIILSPLTVLLSCMERTGEKGLKESEFYKAIMKHINISAFLMNVFKPTIIVLGLGVATLFVSFMKTTVTNFADRQFNYNGVNFSSHNEGTSMDGKVRYTSTMDHNLFSFTLKSVGKTILELIFSFLTIILVYQIVKAAVTMGGGKDFVSSKIDNIQKSVGKTLGSMPLLPVAGYDKEGAPTTHYISANKVFNINNGEPNSELLNSAISKYQGKVDNEYNEQNQNIIKSWFGDDTGYLSAEEKHSITAARQNNINYGIVALNAMKDAISKTEKGKGMTLNPQTSSNNGFWIEEFSAWLEGMEKKIVTGTGKYDDVWNKMINRWNNEGNKDAHTLQEKSEKLQTMFGSVSNSAMAYAQYFFDSDDERAKISNWNDLKNADISKKKPEEKSE